MISWIFLTAMAQAQAQVPSPFFEDLRQFREKSLTLQTERGHFESAGDRMLSANLFWTPTLSVSAHQARTQVGGVQSDAGDVTADLNLNLFRGGGGWDRRQEAKALLRASELAVINEELRVEVKAADAIFKSIYLAETARLQENLSELKKESLKIANDRYGQGKLPRQEVSKTEVDLTQQRNRARSARLDVVENLSLVRSLFVENLKTKAWPFSDVVEVRLGAAERSPVAEQKYWQSRASEREWQSAKSGHWPSLDLGVQYKQWPLPERDQSQTQGLLTLTLPIWSRFETSAAVSSAYSRYLGAENDFRETDQASREKATFLKEKINVARVNLKEARVNLEKSQELYRDTVRSFRLGRISTNDLLLEQNRLLESETALAFSQLTFHQALIESCALAGVKAQDCIH